MIDICLKFSEQVRRGMASRILQIIRFAGGSNCKINEANATARSDKMWGGMSLRLTAYGVQLDPAGDKYNP
jgi:hypothetical protein